MGLPPSLVYQSGNENRQPPRRGFRNLFAEQDTPDAGRRGKETCRHGGKYLYQPKVEPPEIIVVAADIPSVSAVNLLKGRGSMLLIGKQKIRQLMVDMAAALTAVPPDHQNCLCPILPDKVPPAGADGRKLSPAKGTGMGRSPAPQIKRLFSPSSIL